MWRFIYIYIYVYVYVYVYVDPCPPFKWTQPLHNNLYYYTVTRYTLNKIQHECVKLESVYSSELSEVNNRLQNKVKEIKCTQYNGTYIEQTSRLLHNIMLNHAISTKNYKVKTTALAQHAHNFKHNFDFKEVTILEEKTKFKKRLCLKMIHIQKNNNSINFRTDIENLSDIYFNIIKLFKFET